MPNSQEEKMVAESRRIGFLRAPMTSVFMVLELSGNYSIILPVIVANTFAYVISRTLQPMAIFDVLTRQDGLDLPCMEDQREEGILRVEDAMQSRSPDPQRLGSAKKQELRKMANEGKGRSSLSYLLTIRQVPYLHPDHLLETALRYIDRCPLLPVVSRADFRLLEGVISQHDVLGRYRDY